MEQRADSHGVDRPGVFRRRRHVWPRRGGRPRRELRGAGRRQAEIAAQLLRGQRPSPTEAGTNVYRFDARQILRSGLDATRLPPGSDIAFAEPSVWQTYRGYIVGAVGVLACRRG